jgi:hypothetical protein
MNITQSYDPAVYKLVTRARSRLIGFDAKELSTIEKFLDCFPADLPGVVAHSGEPVAIIDESDEGLFADLIVGNDGINVKRGNELFTHADPAEVAALRQRVSILDGEAIGLFDQLQQAKAERDSAKAQLAQQDGAQPIGVVDQHYAFVEFCEIHGYRSSDFDTQTMLQLAFDAGRNSCMVSVDDCPLVRPASEPTPEAIVKAVCSCDCIGVLDGGCDCGCSGNPPTCNKCAAII